MKFRKILLAGLMASVVVLSGCSDSGSSSGSDSQEVQLVSPKEESSIEETPEEKPEEEPKEEEAEESEASGEEKPEEEPKEDKEEAPEEEPKEEETQEEDKEEFSEESVPETDMPEGVQGCYKLFDTGFEVTVSDPFRMYYDPLSNNMTVYSQNDAGCRGYIFYDDSGAGMDQLENEVRNLEDAAAEDPTITDLEKEVNDQGNGLFSFTFSYSAGESEGSPAGYFIVHYQKTEQGILSVNFFTERNSETQAIHSLVDTIQAVTGQAQDYPQ